MAVIIVKLECITNMHVGNGDVNYNIIDNEVERDPVTGYPTINASGVKGALRNYFSGRSELKGKVDSFFGAEKEGNSTPGALKILSANMIAIPTRANKGEEPFYLVTTKEALGRFHENEKIFLGKENNIVEKSVTNRGVEGILLNKAVEMFDKDIHILSEEDFRKLYLPVLARNKLENGSSMHLWYEEVVPYNSIFIFVVLTNEESILRDFSSCIDNKVIQFGGNASIGYGLCKVSVIGDKYYE